MKEKNEAWLNLLLKKRNSMNKGEEKEKKNVDWVYGSKNFKTEVKFKVMPPSNKENDIFAWVVGTH